MMTFSASKVWFTRLAAATLIIGLGWFATKNTVFAQWSFAYAWPNTDFSTALVDLSEIRSGGPPKDGIPAIDHPQFESVTQAAQWLHHKEPVIVLSRNDETKAYPIQIMTWHEIVNDTVGATPVSVTFCPLCNAPIAYDRRIEGRQLDFGTTGKLRKSDLIMYDRQTETWWQQFTGQAIVGELAGTVLKRLPATIVSFADFERAYPDGLVLSRKTGHLRAYGNNPYRGYDSTEDQPFLFFDPVDRRLPPMERVLNISIGETNRLYPFTLFKRYPIINDDVGAVAVVVFSRHGTFSALDAEVIAQSREISSASAYRRELDGQRLTFVAQDGRIIDEQTGSTWNLFGTAVAGKLRAKQLEPVESGVHFAFAWLAFNPDSELYMPPKP